MGQHQRGCHQIYFQVNKSSHQTADRVKGGRIFKMTVTFSRGAELLLTGSDSFSQNLPPVFGLLDMLPWPRWRGVSMEGPSRCADASLFQSAVHFTLAKYGEWTGGRKKGRKPRKKGWKSSQSQRFLHIVDFSLLLQEEFPPFTESSGSHIASAPLQMDSADLRKDAVYITAIFVSTSTVGSTVGKGNRPHNMWKPFGRGLGGSAGRLWHSSASLALTQTNIGLCRGA